ncbi:MAG: DUF4097 domain-containing protein [Lachnospiraceae bacterium]|nr:DUF4097 domain-containing protein [Lachnospiraceae bacterium]
MNKRIYLIILYVLTLFICFAAISHHLGRAVSGCGSCVAAAYDDYKWDYSKWDTTELSGERIKKDYDCEDVTEIQANISVSTFVIKDGDEYNVHFDGDKVLEPTVTLEGKRLVVKQPEVRLKASAFRSDSEITITIPGGRLDSLKVDASVGDITVNGIKVDEINLDAAVGVIKVDDIKVSEKSRFDAHVGDIRISDSSLADTDIDAAVGAIKLTDTDFEDADIDAAVGDVNISGGVDIDDYTMDLDCALGNVKINGRNYGKKHRTGSGKYSLRIDANVGEIKITEK